MKHTQTIAIMIAITIIVALTSPKSEVHSEATVMTKSNQPEVVRQMKKRDDPVILHNSFWLEESIFRKKKIESMIVPFEEGTIELEEYVVGVVAREMEQGFMEALKAQAIAARTYALYYLKSHKVLLNSTLCQAYYSDSELKVRWGNEYEKKMAVIQEAVMETRGLVITYKGKVINSVYHWRNHGQTKSGTEVWGGTYPYLQSVSSPWDNMFTKATFGHEVGMSQCGAEGMAQEGCSYEQILLHFYQGVEISEYKA